MQTQVTQTNTTSAVATLSHDDIVRVLGLAVAVDAGLRSDAPGTTITAELAPAETDGEFTATVSVLVDHNYVPPKPDAPAGSGATDPSLNPGGQPTVPTIPVIPPAAASGPTIGGLQIPGAPAA